MNGADGDEEKQNWLVNIRQTNQCHRVTGVGGLTVGLGDGYFMLPNSLMQEVQIEQASVDRSYVPP